MILRIVALGALAALAVSAPAGAVIDGVPDGVRHPYVGAVDGRPVGGPVKFGSGVLISPTVFLTVAHGTAHFDAAELTRARVTQLGWLRATRVRDAAGAPATQGGRREHAP